VGLSPEKCLQARQLEVRVRLNPTALGFVGACNTFIRTLLFLPANNNFASVPRTVCDIAAHPKRCRP
jgi:hypothetical protein